MRNLRQGSAALRAQSLVTGPDLLNRSAHALAETLRTKPLSPLAQLLGRQLLPQTPLLKVLQGRHQGSHALLGEEQPRGLITAAANAAHAVE